MPAKEGSLRHYASRYAVSHELVRKLKAEGIDLEDTEAVAARLEQEGAGLPEVPRTIPSPVSGAGLGAAIERLKAAEEALHEDYLVALQRRDRSAGVLLKQWSSVVEQLRKVEADNPSIQQAKAESISKEDLASVLASLFANLRQDLDSLARRVGSELEMKTVLEIEPVIQRETSRIVDSLFACAYLKGAVNE